MATKTKREEEPRPSNENKRLKREVYLLQNKVEFVTNEYNKECSQLHRKLFKTRCALNYIQGKYKQLGTQIDDLIKTMEYFEDEHCEEIQVGDSKFFESCNNTYLVGKVLTVTSDGKIVTLEHDDAIYEKERKKIYKKKNVTNC